MRCCQTLPDQRNRRVLRLVHPHRTDEAPRLVNVVKFDLHIPLHEPASCEFESFRSVRLAYLGRISCSPGRTNTSENQGERLVLFGKIQPAK